MVTRMDGGKEDRGRKDGRQGGRQRGSSRNSRGGRETSERMDNNEGQAGWRASRGAESEFEEQQGRQGEHRGHGQQRVAVRMV